MFSLKKRILVISMLLLFTHFISNGQSVRHGFFKNQRDTINSVTDLPWSQLVVNKLDTVVNENIFVKHLSSDPFIQHTTKGSRFLINPHVNFSTDHCFDSDENYLTAGGGLNIRFQRESKWLFDANILIYKNDNYLIDSTRIIDNLIPGVLWSEPRNAGFIAANITARLGYKPSKYFQFETGIDNHFVGDGRHSVFLGSENTPHPFGQISTSFWKIDYAVVYHLLNDVRWPSTDKTYRKYMTSHQLNIKLHRTLNIYIYEAVIWKAEDSITNRGYDLSYLNPIIFFRPVEFNLGNPSPDNVLMGIGGRWQPRKWVRLYGQALIDEFYLKELKARNGWWANKFAMQAGIALKTGMNNHFFNFRGEFNMARPYTYSHIQSMQNYGSSFYPLAHLLGANFREILFQADWSYKRISLFMQMALASVGVDNETTNYGQNIYRSYTDRQTEYGHEWLQGNLQENLVGELRVSYVLNEPSNLTISTGVRRISQFVTEGLAAGEFNQVYVRLATFLTPTQKQMYNTSNLFR